MRKEKLTRGCYQSIKVAKAIHGATFGTPSIECFPVVLSPSPIPQRFPANPNIQQLLDNLPRLNIHTPDNLIQPLIWSPRQLDLLRLFSTLISHSDDHKAKIAREFFPVDLCISYITAIKDNSRKIGRPLDILEQFNIALELAEGSIFSAVILAQSASRAISRNKDQRVNPKFVFSPEDMNEWGQSIARFDNHSRYDPPGDTYHFWAMCAMGMALENKWARKSFAKSTIHILFRNGTEVMSAARSMLAGNPLYFKHKEVDEQGFQLGYHLANISLPLLEDRKLKLEVFPGKPASQVSGFTNKARIYER